MQLQMKKTNKQTYKYANLDSVMLQQSFLNNFNIILTMPQMGQVLITTKNNY